MGHAELVSPWPFCQLLSLQASWWAGNGRSPALPPLSDCLSSLASTAHSTWSLPQPELLLLHGKAHGTGQPHSCCLRKAAAWHSAGSAMAVWVYTKCKRSHKVGPRLYKCMCAFPKGHGLPWCSPKLTLLSSVWVIQEHVLHMWIFLCSCQGFENLDILLSCR